MVTRINVSLRPEQAKFLEFLRDKSMAASVSHAVRFLIRQYQDLHPKLMREFNGGK